MNKKARIHAWRKLKWPFTATFLYYSLLSLYTGTAEQSEQGFLVMFLTVLIVDAVAYFSYCYFLCKKEENMQKLWFVFILAYVLISTQQLSILWQMMTRKRIILLNIVYMNVLSPGKGRFLKLCLL